MEQVSRARRDDKAMREREERDSHELSKLKQGEYNLRVSAAKVRRGPSANLSPFAVLRCRALRCLAVSRVLTLPEPDT